MGAAVKILMLGLEGVRGRSI